MRFILNFFLFGFLFFLIWMFFPEAFQTLFSWANSVYEFLRDGFRYISETIKTKKPVTSGEEHKVLFRLWAGNLFT